MFDDAVMVGASYQKPEQDELRLPVTVLSEVLDILWAAIAKAPTNSDEADTELGNCILVVPRETVSKLRELAQNITDEYTRAWVLGELADQPE